MLMSSSAKSVDLVPPTTFWRRLGKGRESRKERRESEMMMLSVRRRLLYNLKVGSHASDVWYRLTG
jgi:hypothetical protein